MRQSSARRLGGDRLVSALLVAVVLAFGLVVVRSGGSGSGTSWTGVVALAAVAGLLLASAVASVWHAFSAPTVAELATFSTVYAVELSPGGVALVDRYLSRVRRYRWAWFWIALGVGVAVLLAVPPRGGSGVGPGAAIALGCSGSFVGAVLAELYNLRPARRRGTRTAALERRSLDAYLLRSERRRVWIAGVALAGLPVVSATGGGVGWHRAGAYALIAVVLVGTVEVLQRHVVARARPAIDSDLARADDAIREAAVRDGIGRSGFALLLLALADAAGAMGAGLPALLLLIAAIGYWRDRPRRAAERPRPPRSSTVSGTVP